eukprot:TRINITY_DN11511_c0_g1_i2.p1 TRINITY_DN11511_c0_g1~~TRINITY_DN11511_c0_g1_i2.p1  ORF type:complete len:504 (+),score=94.60 TRINITY_DN11511_c0_g1_i2:81-1592(+)
MRRLPFLPSAATNNAVDATPTGEGGGLALLSDAMQLTDAGSGTPAGRRRLLLGGLSFGSEEAQPGFRVCVLEVGQSGPRDHESARLLSLVRELWPGVEQPDRLCRTLRFLNDSSKEDFLLRPMRDAVLVRTDFVRAIVEPDRIIFLRTDNKTFLTFRAEFVEEFSRRTFTAPEDFACWAVECIVCATVTVHSLRLQMMRSVSENLLQNLRLEHYDSILRLYPLKLALTSSVEQMRPLVQGLHGVLQLDAEREGLGDRDVGGHHARSRGGMSRLRSTSSSEQLTSMGAIASGAAAHSARGYGVPLPPGLEEVLHNWAHNAEEIMADIAGIGVRIEDTMRFLEASMSCTRNQLLMFELWTMIATLSMAFGALVSGIFGMNIDSGVEHVNGLFIGMILFILAMGVIIAILSWIAISRSHSHYQAHSARFGNNKFFRSVGDDEYVLSLSEEFKNGHVNDDALNRLLRELQQPALPVRAEGWHVCRRRATTTLSSPSPVMSAARSDGH